MVLIWPQQLSASQPLILFFFPITSLHHRIVAEKSKANGTWNGMDPVTQRICGKTRTNYLFPKLLPQPFDFHSSCMGFVIWSHLPFLLHWPVTLGLSSCWMRGKWSGKGVTVVHYSIPIVTFWGLFLSLTRVVFRQECNISLVIHSTGSSFKRMMVEKHLDLLFLIFRTNF